MWGHWSENDESNGKSWNPTYVCKQSGNWPICRSKFKVKLLCWSFRRTNFQKATFGKGRKLGKERAYDKRLNRNLLMRLIFLLYSLGICITVSQSPFFPYNHSDTKNIVNLMNQIKDVFVQTNLLQYRLLNILHLHNPVSQVKIQKGYRRRRANPSKRGTHGWRNITIHNQKINNGNISYQKVIYLTLINQMFAYEQIPAKNLFEALIWICWRIPNTSLWVLYKLLISSLS